MSNINQEVDQKKLTKMYMKIRQLESNNLKTGRLDDKQVVNMIVQIIAEILKEEE